VSRPVWRGAQPARERRLTLHYNASVAEAFNSVEHFEILKLFEMIYFKERNINLLEESSRAQNTRDDLSATKGGLESTNTLNDISDEEFLDWFRGFTEAEGCFMIGLRNNGSSFRFEFKIFLHKLFLSKTLDRYKNSNKLIKFINCSRCLSGYRLNHGFLQHTLSSQVNPRFLQHNISCSQLNTRFLHHTISCSQLNPWFVTGYADAESSFMLLISKNNKCKTGYSVLVRFSICIHKKDYELLEKVASFFGTGKIDKGTDKSVLFRVTSFKDITEKIIPHFDKYPLITQKLADYNLFKLAVEIINRKEHLTPDGFQKILSIKSKINLGLPTNLKSALVENSGVERPLVLLPETINSHWLAGFASGEGCFSIIIRDSSSNKTGKRVVLIFRITQHSRDAELMKKLSDYLKCGQYYFVSNKNKGDLVVQNFTHINEIIIPFFKKYPIQGTKFKDFEDFCKAAELISNKCHLTQEGIEIIRKLKLGMNRGRDS